VRAISAHGLTTPMTTGLAAVQSAAYAADSTCAGVDGDALEPSVIRSGARGCTASSFACCWARGARAA
jgi:hypothetical protein